MSGFVTGWVLKNSPVDGAARMVLVILADHAASDGGRSYPSVATIAEEGRLSRSTVQRALRQLEADGHIVKDGTERKGVHCWSVLMPEGGAAQSGGPHSEAGRIESSGGAAQCGPNRPLEPSIAPYSPPSEDPVQAIFDHWRTVMDHPDARLDAVRRRMIERALKHSTPADCCRAIDGCANSDFHMARGEYNSSTRYDAISLILRNREKIEWFISLAPAQGGVSEEEKRAIIAVRAGRDLAASGEMAARAGDARELLIRRGWEIITDDASGSVQFTPPAKTGGEGLTPPS